MLSRFSCPPTSYISTLYKLTFQDYHLLYMSDNLSVYCPCYIREGFQKKKIMEFSIKGKIQEQMAKNMQSTQGGTPPGKKTC